MKRSAPSATAGEGINKKQSRMSPPSNWPKRISVDTIFDKFAEEVFCKCPAVASDPENSGFCPLLPWEISSFLSLLDRNLSEGVNFPTGVNVIATKKQTPVDVGSTGSNLGELFLDGHSVIVNHAEMLIPELLELCESLESELSLPLCFTNLYLTPPNCQVRLTQLTTFLCFVSPSTQPTSHTNSFSHTIVRTSKLTRTHTTYYIQHTTYNIQHITYNIQHTTYNIHIHA